MAKGYDAIQAQLPAGVTVETASHSQILQALEAAAHADPDGAIHIAAAVVRARWDVLDDASGHPGGVVFDGDGKATRELSDGKRTMKEVLGPETGALDGDPRVALLIEMAEAIIRGASPDPANPEASLVAAVLQAMLFALPADTTGIGALLIEGVLANLSPEVANQLADPASALRSIPVYQFSAPPGSVPVEQEIIEDVLEEDDTAPRPRPTPQPVTPVVNV